MTETLHEAARPDDIAILLPGGGARAAYQVGALCAIARILARDRHSPFRIVCGTSAGAINAATLALHADSFRRGVARLLRWWRALEVEMVYRADLASVAAHGMRWLASVLVGASGPKQAASMLNNAPLRALLQKHLDLDRVAAQIATGNLLALAINATSYTTGHAVTFFQGSPSLLPWRRTRRRGEAAMITIDHLLASTAIPFVFPAARLGDDYFADGSVRQITPLSPALHLGARRILVIAVGQFSGQRPTGAQLAEPRYPSFAQMAGHALSSIFLDNLGADVERLQRLNHVLNLVPGERQAHHPEVSHIDAMVLSPSRDLGAMAPPYAKRLPRGVRYLLRGLGSTEGTGASLLSYLLFDRRYTKALIDLGFQDAMKRRDEIDAFLDADALRFAPLFPPELA
ncbi:MAG TPA: patatin-like phospholipase family protein [Casimicrobiaceae bacterium]|jgi:NTE family protein|nr:patatin-like phospholipase family protein [Casimicrobiaceae bacterium]